MLQNSPHLSHPKYRADIDGLRAIAVLAVVTFHAFPSWVKGGFIGVDVFFVISGYLISTIIFENLDKGTFSFSVFYSRRIKRIFPSLLLVLIACFAFGWFALLADEYKQLGKHIAAGVGFMTNFILWNEAGYFDNTTETKPLLHLWSLGIEEQFYITWPFFLWFAWKRKFNLLTITIIIGAASFILSLKGVKQDIVATFYSPQTRFWELLSGSLLAWFTLYKKDAFANIKSKIDVLLSRVVYSEKIEGDGRILANVLSFSGLFLLLYGFWHINKELSFPGKWALVPVLGAVLIIAAGSQAWVNRQILSNKIAVWFGLISFPLYLWHWPLLSFARIVESEVPSRNIRIAAILLSIVLSWLTYKLVEHPIRFGKHGKVKVTALVLFMVIVGYVGFNTYDRDGLKFRDAEKTTKINRFDLPYKESCKEISGEIYGDDWCNSGTKLRNPPSTVMVGDSFSNAYSTLLQSYSEKIDTNFSFRQIGRGQCPSLLNYGPAYCQLITKKSFEFIQNSPDVKTVIFSSNWPAYYNGKDFKWVKHIESKDAFVVAFEETVNAYKNIGKQVIVLFAPPGGGNPKSCIIRPVRLTDKNICNLLKSQALANDGDYRTYLISFLNRNNIKYFDPFQYFCDEYECKITEGGKIFTADSQHLSVFGGEFLATKASTELKNLFSN